MLHVSTCHGFPFLFRLPGTWLFISNSVGVTRNAEDAYPTGAPGPSSHAVFSGVRVTHLVLLFCMYYFIYFMSFVVIACFTCLVFFPELHSFDFCQNLGSLDYSLTTSSKNKVYVSISHTAQYDTRIAVSLNIVFTS